MRLRSCLFFSLTLFLLISIFNSCRTAFDEAPPPGNNESISFSIPDWNGGEKTFDVRSSTQAGFEIPSNIKDVNIAVKPANGKKTTIHYANINVGGTFVQKEQAQYITKTPVETANYSIRSSSSTPDGNFLDPLLEANFYRKEHLGAQNFVPPKEITSRSAGGTSPSPAPTRETYTASDVGKKTKTLWIDNTNSGSYQQKQATLRAVGTHCYVWVVDDYFTYEVDSGSKVSSTTAQTIASKFDSIYLPEREIFGEEFWEGITVNIVIFDIYGDYKDTQMGGVFGYFHGKDYYPYESHTNYGKYFYIDSYFSHGSENFKKEIYSTLVHEFQHMINWNQKRVKYGQVSETWYNEMLSLIAEDMMQSKLGISNVLVSRYKSFCEGYYLSGITDWLYGDHVYYSYAMAAVFGAYLTRNYGGAQLVKNISQNGLANFPSITAATGKSIEDLIKGFVEAVSLPNGGLNKDAPTPITYSGYNYPMGAINLYSVSWGSGHRGPALAGYNAQHSLRPYGFMLHSVGYANGAGTVKLSFSSRPNNDTRLCVYTYEN